MPEGIGYGPKGSSTKPKKLKRKKHSPAGKLRKELGEKGYYSHIRGVQRRLTRQKRIDALDPIPHDPNETNVQKERRGYIPSSVGSTSKSLSYAEWLKKTGKGATANTVKQWRAQKKKAGR